MFFQYTLAAFIVLIAFKILIWSFTPFPRGGDYQVVPITVLLFFVTVSLVGYILEPPLDSEEYRIAIERSIESTLREEARKLIHQEDEQIRKKRFDDVFQNF